MDPLARLYRLAAHGRPQDFIDLLKALRDSVYDVRQSFPGVAAPTEESRKIAGAILTDAIARLERLRKNEGRSTSKAGTEEHSLYD